MATALVAHLGFRPALAPPGRSCWFAGACQHPPAAFAVPCVLASQTLLLSARAATRAPSNRAVRQTLCKPALRRLAAQPAAPAPLPPFQPQGQLQGAAPQPAPSAKPFSPTRTAIKLILFAAVGGFIVQPPLPYWVILGQLVCATLMYGECADGVAGRVCGVGGQSTGRRLLLTPMLSACCQPFDLHSTPWSAASVNPGELAAALPALPQPAPSAKRFSKQRFLVKVILGVAVYGYILQAPAPYWFSWAMLICVALMYGECADGVSAHGARIL